jgi:hypothetical protein
MKKSLQEKQLAMRLRVGKSGLDKEPVRRGHSGGGAKKDVCGKGHPRTPDNVTKSRTCKQCQADRQAKLRVTEPQRLSAWWRKANVGISADAFNSRLASQNYLCACCGEPFTQADPAVVDHDHGCCRGRKTCGKCWRGLVHNSCNVRIGAWERGCTLTKYDADVCHYLWTFIGRQAA